MIAPSVREGGRGIQGFAGLGGHPAAPHPALFGIFNFAPPPGGDGELIYLLISSVPTPLVLCHCLGAYLGTSLGGGYVPQNLVLAGRTGCVCRGGPQRAMPERPVAPMILALNLIGAVTWDTLQAIRLQVVRQRFI